MTHEVGHFLNLFHPFDNVIGAGPCGDDDVADTPITQSSGCDLTLSGCNPPVIENVQNFMTGSYCFIMFTEGQKTRMVNCLNSNEGSRRNLWQVDNLAATLGADYAAGLLEAQELQLQVWPNPASDELFVEYKGKYGSVGVELYDLLGQQLWSGDVHQDQSAQIAVGDYTEGTYILKVLADGQYRSSQLVTVTH